MTTWRKIRDTSEMNVTAPYHTDNLRYIHELAAWPDFWVLRGGTLSSGHILYGLDIEANRLIWAINGLKSPEGLGWTWTSVPLLARTADLAVVATYVGHNREQVWLLAVKPSTGELVWRKPLTWFRRTSSGKISSQPFIGIGNTGTHLLVMENRAVQAEQPYLLWLDPATGETIHECPAPVSKEPAIVARGYIYLHNHSAGSGRGLYRIPATPGEEAFEQILTTRVTSLLAQGNLLYVTHTEKLQDWTFARWDASDLTEQGTQTLHWDESRYWPRLMAADPEQPDHVIINRGTRLWELNLRTGEMLWEQESEKSPNIRHLLLSPHGALLNLNERVEGLDLRTGTREDLGLNGVVDVVLTEGDYLLASHAFGTDSYLYVAEGTPAAITHPEPVTGDETWTTMKLRDLLPDLFTDPRDELETAFSKAAGRGSLNTLFKIVRRITNTSQTHQKVKAYFKALKAGELGNGPLDFLPLTQLHTGCFFYSDLFGFGPEDRFFPGILIAGEEGGVEFYLMLETGKVIALHHDASFFEVASDVWNEVEERVGAFEREFPAQGSILDITQLIRLQQTFADLESTGKLQDVEILDFLNRTAEAFGWSLKELRRHLDEDYLLLEFLNIHDEELELLEATEKNGNENM